MIKWKRCAGNLNIDNTWVVEDELNGELAEHLEKFENDRNDINVCFETCSLRPKIKTPPSSPITQETEPPPISISTVDSVPSTDPVSTQPTYQETEDPHQYRILHPRVLPPSAPSSVSTVPSVDSIDFVESFSDLRQYLNWKRSTHITDNTNNITVVASEAKCLNRVAVQQITETGMNFTLLERTLQSHVRSSYSSLTGQPMYRKDTTIATEKIATLTQMTQPTPPTPDDIDNYLNELSYRQSTLSLPPSSPSTPFLPPPQ